jgi:hypothetical protein
MFVNTKKIKPSTYISLMQIHVVWPFIKLIILGIAHGFAISYTFLLNRLFSFLPDTIDLNVITNWMLLCPGAEDTGFFDWSPSS